MDFSILKSNLEFNGFTVSIFESANDATEYLDKNIDGTSVGMGGSMTLEKMGVFEKLKTHNQVFWHQKQYEDKTPNQIKADAAVAKVYLSSLNALAKTGELINIDGAGNRVGATYYGHEKVYFVVGKNKIAENLESAIQRARNVAAPLNAKRLNRKTPCAITADKCYNCNSPERICCGLSVFLKAPLACKYEVILINEDLGF